MTFTQSPAGWGPPLLAVSDVRRAYYESRQMSALRRQSFDAVAGVSLELRQSETVALVGESGCGKSTLTRLLLGLEEPSAGQVEYEGRDLRSLATPQRRQYRRDVQVVFQDPGASLNPRKRARKILATVLRVNGMAKEDVPGEVERLLEAVGLTPPRLFTERFPSQMSGGQQQRVAIARAIALKPRFIVADEPVSSLDLSVQAQIIDLLRDLQDQLEVGYLFITHDLNVVREIADRVAVMYLGRIVELGDVDQVLTAPQHPYTRALLSARLIADPRVALSTERRTLISEAPSPKNTPGGCPFRTRCPIRHELCAEVEPLLEFSEATNSYTACHFPASKT